MGVLVAVEEGGSVGPVVGVRVLVGVGQAVWVGVVVGLAVKVAVGAVVGDVGAIAGSVRAGSRWTTRIGADHRSQTDATRAIAASPIAVIVLAGLVTLRLLLGAGSFAKRGAWCL